MVAEADDLRVISKQAVENSWVILSAILGQNQPVRNLQPKSEFDHICVFPYACAPLTFDLDSELTMCLLPPSWLSGMWVYFSIVRHTCPN